MQKSEKSLAVKKESRMQKLGGGGKEKTRRTKAVPKENSAYERKVCGCHPEANVPSTDRQSISSLNGNVHTLP